MAEFLHGCMPLNWNKHGVKMGAIKRELKEGVLLVCA